LIQKYLKRKSTKLKNKFIQDNKKKEFCMKNEVDHTPHNLKPRWRKKFIYNFRMIVGLNSVDSFEPFDLTSDSMQYVLIVW